MSAFKFYPWKDEYEVGIAEIDKQHKVLVEHINELYEAVVEQKADAKAKEIIIKLHSYSLFHFETEENLFRKFGYPATNEHIAEHEKFKVKIGEFDEVSKGNYPVTFRIVQFLKDWLGNHIMKTDKLYVPFLSKHIK